MAQEIADSTLLDTWASSGLIVEPDISKIIEGWQLGEQPPHEYMNWLQNTFGSKLNHILKNGVVKWNDETPYLAGSSVQHNGNVWLCKITNTNSAPTDANANWKRIITVESLTTVLGGYVNNSGNETIAGVKTFSSSPIVPTPTTGTQAVNKDYADTKTTLAQANSYDIGVNQTLQNFVGDKAANVTYTNNTGKPIVVSVYYGAAIESKYCYVDGVNVGGVPSNSYGTVTFIVPHNSTYMVTWEYGADVWSELR